MEPRCGRIRLMATRPDEHTPAASPVTAVTEFELTQPGLVYPVRPDCTVPEANRGQCCQQEARCVDY
jgi:hypothetical protein